MALSSIGEIEKSRKEPGQANGVGVGTTCCFWLKTVCYRDATAIFFVANVREKVFAQFHTIYIKITLINHIMPNTKTNKLRGP
jgi:hypothetical protein